MIAELGALGPSVTAGSQSPPDGFEAAYAVSSSCQPAVAAPCASTVADGW